MAMKEKLYSWSFNSSAKATSTYFAICCYNFPLLKFEIPKMLVLRRLNIEIETSNWIVTT